MDKWKITKNINKLLKKDDQQVILSDREKESGISGSTSSCDNVSRSTNNGIIDHQNSNSQNSNSNKSLNQNAKKSSQSQSKNSSSSYSSSAHAQNNNNNSSNNIQKYPEFNFSSNFTPFSALCNESIRQSLTKDEMKRQDRIYEFIYLEKLHTRRLRIIQVIFYETLRRHLPFDEFEDKIPAVESLISLHTKLVDLFSTEFSNQSADYPPNNGYPFPIKNFGQALKKWLMLSEDDDPNDRSPTRNFKLFIEACKEFCKKQLSAGLWVHEQCRLNPELQFQLKEAENHYLVNKLPFANYLAAQMQHLTKYPMLIESILAKTDKKSVDGEYPIIEEVRNQFKEILVDVNSAVKIFQDQQKHQEIAEQLDVSVMREYKEMRPIIFNLVPTNLYHYGVLNFNRQNYDCLLFENVFVMTTVRSPGSRQYVLKPAELPNSNKLIFPVMRINYRTKIYGDFINYYKDLESQSHASDSDSISKASSGKTTKSYENNGENNLFNRLRKSNSSEVISQVIGNDRKKCSPRITAAKMAGVVSSKNALKNSSSLNPDLLTSGNHSKEESNNSKQTALLEALDANRALTKFEFILISTEPKQNLRLKCNLAHEKDEWLAAFNSVIKKTSICSTSLAVPISIKGHNNNNSVISQTPVSVKASHRFVKKERIFRSKSKSELEIQQEIGGDDVSGSYRSKNDDISNLSEQGIQNLKKDRNSKTSKSNKSSKSNESKVSSSKSKEKIRTKDGKSEQAVVSDSNSIQEDDDDERANSKNNNNIKYQNETSGTSISYEDKLKKSLAKKNKLGISSSIRSTNTMGDYDSLAAEIELDFDIDSIMKKYEI